MTEQTQDQLHQEKTMNDQTQVQVPSRSASRELDAEVAEKVLGIAVTWRRDPSYPYAPGERKESPMLRRTDNSTWWQQLDAYSTRIAAAWRVVEVVRERMLTAEVCATDIGWLARFDTGASTYEAAAPTAPLAICRAALVATEAA